VIALALALAAGLVTVASPCILPMLPVLLGASWGRRDARRPLFVVTGFVASFAATALAFGASTRVLGVSHDAVRGLAIAALCVFGLLSLFPRTFETLSPALSRIGDTAARLPAARRDTPVGALALGASLGALWTPCAGPALASILVLLGTAQDAGRAAPLLAAYALGAGLPMLAIAYGGRAASRRLDVLARHAGAVRRAFGLLVLATALAMLRGYDASAAAWLSDLVPAAESPRPTAPSVRDAAPELAGIEAWLNSPPLRLADLRGKVVLVDFWTFACSNCARTLPSLERWHARYADEGLVVIGVHTPEFAFERERANVEAAVRRFGIDYPVALDNRYETWTAWRNRYWPSLYLVDREGRLVLRHEGEGDYEEIERAIEAALRPDAASRASAPRTSSSTIAPAGSTDAMRSTDSPA
jgi:cytochrome c biogenesis protein CcdA/thiol-disulfide isomerase/thioredoxin